MSLVCNIEDKKGFVSAKANTLSLKIKQIKPIVKLLIRQGVEPQTILANTGISTADLIRRDISINAQQHHQLLLNAYQHAPDMSFAAQLGEQDFINHDSLLACRVMSCDTVTEGMHLLTDYYKLWTNQFDLCFEENEQGGIFSVIPHIDFGLTLPFYIEYMYAILYAFGCFCLGEKSIPLKFDFSYSEPKNSDHYSRYFSNDVRFDQPCNRVFLSKEILSRKLIFSNPELAKANDQKFQSQMQNLHASDAVTRTRKLIEKSALSEVSLESIASQLCVSSRSLRRHLQSEGYSFQGLVDEQRHYQARTLLSQGIKSIQEIALHLGYNDASSFSRAFKRWEQMSPKEYQQRLSLTG